ncbi:MAG: hypoxanthine phosphoribosyltransferase [Candidatus Zixiibacteriota bacterium]
MNAVKSDAVRLKPFDMLMDQQKIGRRIEQLGQQISGDYCGKTPVLIGVLKGCIMFLSDLMRNINIPMELEFISAASYRNGVVQDENILISGQSSIPLKDRHVLLVDGIVDSGRTVRSLISRIEKMEPASIEVATMLDKPSSHREELTIKYKGFSIGNEFVIGYGLDNTQLYRNLPFIGRMVDDR